MGYAVETTGRMLLPESLEKQALTVLEVDLEARAGAFHQDEQVESLAELAGFAGATVRREGDWLVLSTDGEGDPKWSDQATGFYVGLARWVHQGEVTVTGEDGSRWSYRYGPDGVSQVGQNGWDGSLAPFGSPVVRPAPEAPGQDPVEPRPARTLAMAVLLVVGVLLIVGIGMLAAGLVG